MLKKALPFMILAVVISIIGTVILTNRNTFRQTSNKDTHIITPTTFTEALNPTQNPPQRTLTDNPTPISKITTGIPISPVRSATINMKELSAKYQEYLEYRKTDICYQTFQKSNLKNCPSGCFYKKGYPAIEKDAGAPESAAKCIGKQDYLNY